MSSFADFHLSRRDQAVALLIVLVAFALRVNIVFERASAPDNIGAFDPLPIGSDQKTYYGAIEEFNKGVFPPRTYYYQPGMSWFMIISSRLLNTSNLGVLRLFTAALASLNVGIFVVTARLATGRRNVSSLAAALLAIYPVSAFYDTDFVVTSQAIILLNLALLGVLLLWRWPRGWIGVILYGASFGFIAIMRRELLVLAPIFGLWLLWQRFDRYILVKLIIATAICVAIIMPVALHNRSNGADFLITPVANTEIYRGNNRDANGAYHVGPASLSTSQDYMRYLWLDIRLSPRRYAELVVHKIGMFLSSNEPGNNLNYIISGENTSVLLRKIPLDFRILLVLFGGGLFLLIRQRDAIALLFALSFSAMLFMALLMWVEARTRTPVIVFMLVPASICLSSIGNSILKIPVHLKNHGTYPSKQEVLLVSLAIIAIVSVPFLGALAENQLPRDVIVNRLPDSASEVNGVYDSTIKLVGWKIEDQYSRPGIITPFSPYVVTLYWELLQKTSIDYGFGLTLIVNDHPVIVEDHRIGSVNYPFTLTSDWKVGQIYVEHVGLTYKKFDDSLGVSGDLLLSVYRDWNGNEPLIAVRAEGASKYLRLAQPAIMYENGSLPKSLQYEPTPDLFGDVLALVGWQFPKEISAGQPFDVTIGWKTTNHPIQRSFSLAVYAFDEQHQVVAQADSPPHNGDLLTLSLPTNFEFGDVKTLAVSTPGQYILCATVYDLITFSRLNVLASDDDLICLGEIIVH